MELCHCGKPLHYTDIKNKEYVEKIIESQGEYAFIYSLHTQKTYLVPRHYIALHGIKGSELDQLGFKEAVD